MSITLSDAERDTGELSPQNLFDAVENILRHGFAIVENAIPTAIIDRVNERMLSDTGRLLNGEVEGAEVYK